MGRRYSVNEIAVSDANAEDPAQILSQLGLGPDEGLVFTALSRMGPSPAAAVAAATQLSRPQAYRALDLLAGRGVVSTDVGRPRRYSAVPVEKLVLHLREELETKRLALALLGKRLRDTLGTTAEPAPPATFRVDVLRGRETVTAHLRDLHRIARQTIDAVFMHPGGLEIMHRLGGWKSLRDRAASGVRVRLLVPKNQENAERLPSLDRPGSFEVRLADIGERFFWEVVDDRQAVASLVVDSSPYPRAENTRAITIDAPNLVSLLAVAFDALWDASDGPPPS